jgi:molybdopterin converting factor small subunit
VLVNGVQAARDPAARAALRLSAGDTVAIFPPVAGG